MKKTMFTLLGLLVAMLTMAGPVSLQQAQQRAQQFLDQRGTAHASGMRLAKKQLWLEQATSATADAYYYVFNVGEQQGFVIVSGDDRTEEILGYADSGSFSEENMPDNMRAWLEGYQEQMRWMDEHNVQPVNRPAKSNRRMINALLTTTWNQGDPYNYYCPIVPGTTNIVTVTGCAATAMAQVIAYHGLVKGKTLGTIADIPAYSCSTNWNSAGKISVSVKTTCTFDTGNMLNSYKSSYDDAQRDAVAHLMEYCGASLKMEYRPASNGGSSANSDSFVPALTHYFGFDGILVIRNSYTYQQWTDLIYEELDASRPVLYSGQSSGGGHAFVVDGYDGEGLFHVNWGWGGDCDGFFALSVLNPDDNSGIGASTSNDGYSFGQDAVIGVQPSTGASLPLALSIEDLMVSGNKITFGAYNHTGEQNTFDVGVGYIDSEGSISNVKTIMSNQTLKSSRGWSLASSLLSATISGNDQPAGTYKIVAVSKLSSSTNWIAMGADRFYVDAVFDGAGGVTLTQHPRPVDIGVSSVTFPGTKKSGEPQPVIFTIQSNTDDFYGVLHFFASNDSQNMRSRLARGGVTIVGGQSSDLEFQFTPESTGTWYVWLATDENGNDVLTTSSVEIAAGAETSSNVDLTATYSIKNITATGQKLLGTNMEVEVVISNNTDINYSGDVNLLNYVWSGGSGSGYGPVYTVTVPAQSQKTISYTFTDLEIGTVHSLGVRYVKNNNTYTTLIAGNSSADKYTVVAALTSYSADGTPVLSEVTDVFTVPATATAVDFTQANPIPTTVTPNDNSNCLYFFAGDATIPSGLNGKNVVKGNTAESINISEGFDFNSPIAFTAENVSYKRTFDIGYSSDGKGWSTISLPFSVTKVTTDGGARELDWCHSASDTGKNFYLMEFTNDASSTVEFSHANTFEANTPYIIAVAGPEFGTKWNLVGKEMEFSATNAEVPATMKIVSSGSNFKFFGTLATTAAASIYKLNADGNLFQLTSDATEVPFRAYFTSVGGSGGVGSLGIGFNNGTATGIGSVISSTPDAERQGVYTLSGVKVAESSIDDLPSGIYVINGKKVIK